MKWLYQEKTFKYIQFIVDKWFWREVGIHLAGNVYCRAGIVLIQWYGKMYHPGGHEQSDFSATQSVGRARKCQRRLSSEGERKDRECGAGSDQFTKAISTRTACTKRCCSLLGTKSLLCYAVEARKNQGYRQAGFVIVVYRI